MDNTEIDHEQEKNKKNKHNTIRRVKAIDSTRLDRHPGQPLWNLTQGSGVASGFSGDILYRNIYIYSDSYGYGVHYEYALLGALHSKQYEIW